MLPKRLTLKYIKKTDLYLIIDCDGKIIGQFCYKTLNNVTTNFSILYTNTIYS